MDNVRPAVIDLDELERIGSEGRVVPLRAGVVATGIAVDTGELVLDTDAMPSALLMTRLMTKPRFAETWAGTRKDQADQSPSGYDMSLANFVIAAGGSPQDAVDVCILRRREFNCMELEKVLRLDYWERTLAKAVEAHGEKRGRGRPPGPPPLRAPERSADEPPQQAADRDRQWLREQLHMPLERFLKTGTDPADYALVLEDGTEIRLGPAAVMAKPAVFAEKVFDQAEVLLPAYKKAEWVEIVNTLLRIRELRDVDDGDRRAVFLDWLTSYVTENQRTDDEHTFRELALTQRPIIYRGRVYITLGQFAKFIRIGQGYSSITNPELISLMIAYGMKRDKVIIPPAITRSTEVQVRYWHGPQQLVGRGGTDTPDTTIER